MAKLHLQGYLCNNYEGIISLRDKKADKFGDSIIDNIYEFAYKNGMRGHHSKGLGGDTVYIPDCNLRIYYTDKKCSLEEAMLAMDVMMYGGDINTQTSYEGYSEYTITGLNLDRFEIGGHDLKREFNDHYGQYCHIIIEC